MRRWIAFLDTKAKNDLLQQWGGIWNFLGDWVPPGKGQNSLLHGSFLSIDSWFIEGIAGIQLDPTQPGYHQFTVRPGIVGDLTWAKGEYDSLYGPIKTDWRLSDGWLTLTIDVPGNTLALVLMPAQDPTTVTESDRPALQSPGVRGLLQSSLNEDGTVPLQIAKTIDRTAVYRIGSGHYVFRARWRGTVSFDGR
jgi:hypothetical protein